MYTEYLFCNGTFAVTVFQKFQNIQKNKTLEKLYKDSNLLHKYFWADYLDKGSSDTAAGE